MIKNKRKMEMYYKHKDSDLTYGTAMENSGGMRFIQHKWNTFNKKPVEGKARGELANFIHVGKDLTLEQFKDYLEISYNEYECLYYNDYKRH